MSGNGAVAEYVKAGSPPNATATGIFIPNFLYSSKCLAPTLCLCQCIPVRSFLKTCILYIPTFLIPVSGSLVITIGRVIKGPPSFGQHFNTGRILKSGFCKITSWLFPLPDISFGIQDEILLSLGRSLSFSTKLAFGPIKSEKRFSISFPKSSRFLTPKAIHILFSEPIELINKGNPVPLFSNNNALPPFPDFDILSTISVISSSGFTYS